MAKLIRNYEKRKLPKTENFAEFKTIDLTNALNELKKYITLCYKEFSDKERSEFIEKLTFYEKRYLARLAVFDYTTDLPDLFTEIDINTLRHITRETALDISKRYEESDGLESIVEEEDEEQTDINNTDNDEITESIGLNEEFEFGIYPVIEDLFTENILTIKYEINKKLKMAFEYMANVSRIINNNFNGNSEELDSFIAAVELANEATAADQQGLLVKYIRTKLKGEAFDFVPENTPNATRAIALLKEKAKGDSSKVVIGRLLALRSDRTGMQKFQEQAEELCEKLKRAYIRDGMTEALANQTTIDKTVEMCRLSAKTQLVKSVLASTTFEKPKEVLAKFITEATTENTEAKILAFRGQRTQNRGRSNFSYNNNRNNNRNNQNGYNNQNNGQRGRGRGRARGNFNNYRGNFNNYRQNNGNYNNNRNQNDRNIRVVQENHPAPLERGNQGQNVAMGEM